MLRNPGVNRAVTAWLGLAACVTALGWSVGAWRGAALALAGSALGALPFLVLTRRRYLDLAHLSANIDAVLHGDRDLSFSRMEEGELAILGNEIDKMVTRLNLANDELARQKEALADSLADISHQIKTPLTSLSITTELVRKHLAEMPGCAEDLDRLRHIEALEIRVENLVSALLKLARLDAGTILLEQASVDVAEMTRAAVQPLAVALDIAGVAVTHDIPAGCSFMGDAAWTAEAVGNIIKNCMEHTPAGGSIAIHAWEDALACRIRITDTGTGISEHDLPRIFERFYRSESSSSAPASPVNPSGMGIGLSLAQSLIAAQDGTLTACNAIDPETHRVTGAQFDIAFFKAVV